MKAMKKTEYSWLQAASFFLVAIALTLFLYWPTVVSLAVVWTDSSDFSHGWLILPIVGWLIWRNREHWLPVGPKPSYLALVLCLGFGFIWLAGDIARVTVVRQLGLIGFIPALSLLIFGRRFVVKNLFAFCFLFFAVPAGEAFNPILMKYTADATVWALQMTGVPVYRQGLNFVLPTGSWSVVDACSGLRYLISALILGFLFSYLNYTSTRKRVIFMLGCLVLAVVANWIRAYSVVMVGHLSHMKYGTGDDHVWYGWVFFGVVMMGIFSMGTRYGDVLANKSYPLGIPQTAVAKVSLTRYGLVILGVVASAFWAKATPVLNDFSTYNELAQKVLASNPAFTKQPFPFVVGFPNPLSSESAISPSGTRLMVSYFAQQNKNAELFAYGNRLVPEEQNAIRIISENRQSAPGVISAGNLREYTIAAGNETWIVWHWFVIDKFGAADAYSAKAYRALSMLRGRGDHSALLIVAQKGAEATPEIRSRLLQDARILHKGTVAAFLAGN
jgi:exosortase A